VNRSPATSLAALAASAALAAACATPVGVRQASPDDVHRELTANVLSRDEPSPYSRQFLQRLALGSAWRKQPAEALARLHQGLGSLDEPDRLFVLAELSFAYAEETAARERYLAAAVYAWNFLFPEDPELAPSPWDPRKRTALDLYNRGITEGLSAADGLHVEVSSRTVELPFTTLSVELAPGDLEFAGYRLRDFVSVTDLEIRGLRNRYRRPGIGASLAAEVERSGERSRDRWIPPHSKIPVTALLRLADARAALDGRTLAGNLEIYDGNSVFEVVVGDHYTVPLELETSSALAYRLEGAPVWDFALAGFRRGDFRLFGDDFDNGLYMTQPYQRGHIPVVFVHGTASSPARWAEMVNELAGDPALAARYQFWFFVYNTGNPIGVSAGHLRRQLRQVRKDLDPHELDQALDQMVVVGHSQGGLLTRLTVVDSGERLWNASFDVPFKQARLDPDVRDQVRRQYFVRPLPFVDRVIFIATPHRGSFIADNFIGALARRLVALPATVLKASLELATLDPAGALAEGMRPPTAVDNMRPSNPYLRALAELPIDETVTAHSIIGVRQDGPLVDGDDGVVEYTSAHLDGARSELVVREKHSMQSTPPVIEEVRRILYEHLAQAPQRRPGAQAAKWVSHVDGLGRLQQTAP
jgi:pimeloyl-ACP methyl ester carboxylesterase